ncbi:MAG: hypothetical protein AAGD01_11090 [Acidobacteriota bacterium]
MEVMFESSKKSEPFGAHLATKLEESNHKLVCALSSRTTCTDDTQDDGRDRLDTVPDGPREPIPVT